MSYEGPEQTYGSAGYAAAAGAEEGKGTAVPSGYAPAYSNPSVHHFKGILVHSPEVRAQNPFMKYHTYKITTNPSVVDHVYRRYKDFAWLHETLQALFPGVFVPPLPPKKVLGSMDENFVASERQPALQRFLERVSEIPILAESVPFQMFIARPTTFEEGQNEVKRLVSSNTTAATLASYSHYYPHVMSQPLPVSAEHEMAALAEWLDGEQKRLAELVSVSKDLVENVQRQTQLTEKLFLGVHSLYALELRYPALPGPNRCTFTDALDLWHKDMKDVEPAYTDHLLRPLQYELQDVEQMIELVKYRSSLHAKHAKAKARADKWRAPDARIETEKHRQQREADIREEEDLGRLLEAVTKLILLDQNKMVWNFRVTNWSKSVGQFAQAQLTYCTYYYNRFEYLKCNAVQSQQDPSAAAAAGAVAHVDVDGPTAEAAPEASAAVPSTESP